MTANSPDYWLDFDFDAAQEFYKTTMAEATKHGEADKMARRLAETDLFFFVTWVLRRADVAHPWIYARCREVQAAPDGHLDLWARFHYKSTIVTFGLTLWEIVRDPEITICFLSHNNQTAKSFLLQIKTEIESNPALHGLWQGIFWGDPRKESPKWSEDQGLLVKRKSNPKELTVEASGLVDGQPTGKHFKLRIYDDVVTEDSVGTPEQIAKTTKAWELSINLGTEDGGRERYVGTRYHMFDTYAEIIKRGAAKPRLHPATDDGTETGNPVLISREVLAKLRLAQGPYTFAAQQLLNPVADKAMGFREEWLVHKSVTKEQALSFLNRYIVVDPASSRKRKNNDYTSMWVVGTSAAEDYYVLDMVRDRLNLGERAATLMALHRWWRPQNVGYEEYGRDADIEFIRRMQDEELYSFDIIPLGGQVKKEHRIGALIPIFEQRRIVLPPTLIKIDGQGRAVDLVKAFIEEEYLAFPVSAHDDMLDALARILEPELGVIFPDPSIKVTDKVLDYSDLGHRGGKSGSRTSWLTA